MDSGFVSAAQQLHNLGETGDEDSALPPAPPQPSISDAANTQQVPTEDLHTTVQSQANASTTLYGQPTNRMYEQQPVPGISTVTDQASDSGSFVEVDEEEQDADFSADELYAGEADVESEKWRVAVVSTLTTWFDNTFCDVLLLVVISLYFVLSVVEISIQVALFEDDLTKVIFGMAVAQICFCAVFLVDMAIKQVIYEKGERYFVWWNFTFVALLTANIGIQSTVVVRSRSAEEWTNMSGLVVAGNVIKIVLMLMLQRVFKEIINVLLFLRGLNDDHLSAPERVVKILHVLKDKYSMSDADMVQVDWIVHVVATHKLYTGVLELPGGEKPKFQGVDEETRDWIIGTYSNAVPSSNPEAAVSPGTHSRKGSLVDSVVEGSLASTPQTAMPNPRGSPRHSLVGSLGIEHAPSPDGSLGQDKAGTPGSSIHGRQGSTVSHPAIKGLHSKTMSSLLVSTPRSSNRRMMDYFSPSIGQASNLQTSFGDSDGGHPGPGPGSSPARRPAELEMPNIPTLDLVAGPDQPAAALQGTGTAHPSSSQGGTPNASPFPSPKLDAAHTLSPSSPRRARGRLSSTSTMGQLSLTNSYYTARGRTYTGQFSGVDFQSLKQMYSAENRASTTVDHAGKLPAPQSSLSNSSSQAPSQSAAASDFGPSTIPEDVIPMEYLDSLDATDLMHMNESIDDWEFDVFELDQLLCGRPLSFVLCGVFMKNDLYSMLDVDESVASALFMGLESGYRQNNPYHNRIHAADVVQTMHHFCSYNIMRDSITNADLLAGILAAAIHDYNHPGMNNAFLIASGDALAIEYNDRSVLESMHVAAAFRLAHDPLTDRNIFANLSTEGYMEIRETIIQMVLATDMTHHFQMLDMFKSQILVNTPGAAPTPGATMERRTSGGPVGRVKIDTTGVNATRGHHSRERGSNVGSMFSVPPGDSAQKQSTIPSLDVRRTILKMSLHCADVSNPAKPLMLCKRWANRVQEEFFRQGDREKELGLPVSMFMDRTKPAFSKCQLGFISVIVQPLFNTYCQFLVPLKDPVDRYLAQNVAHWQLRQQKDEEHAGIAVAGDGGGVATTEQGRRSPGGGIHRASATMPSLKKELPLTKLLQASMRSNSARLPTSEVNFDQPRPPKQAKRNGSFSDNDVEMGPTLSVSDVDLESQS